MPSLKQVSPKQRSCLATMYQRPCLSNCVRQCTVHLGLHLHGAGDAMPPPSVPQRICNSPLGVSLQTAHSGCCQVQSMLLDACECQPADIRNRGAHSMRQHSRVLSCRKAGAEHAPGAMLSVSLLAVTWGTQHAAAVNVAERVPQLSGTCHAQCCMRDCTAGAQGWQHCGLRKG